jgi:signal transduction histidine kinase
MATINVQASVAAHLAGERADPAVEALKAIKAASREGLNDLRTILGVLRDRESTRQPLPGLAELRSLVEQAEQAGVITTVEFSGAAVPLPTATDAAAFRIIQESLTNVIRHSGSSTARVSVTYHPRSLEIEVQDPGRGSARLEPSVPGYGIKGMRERAAALGGHLEAGPDPERGFRVRATLPIDTPAIALGDKR